MKNKVFYLVALAVGMVFVMSGCKDDECFDETNPDCVNYDPCHDVKPANADFGIYWSVLSYIIEKDNTYSDVNYTPITDKELDTIYTSSWIRFQPFHHSDKFIWYIGEDTSRVNAPLRIFGSSLFKPNKLYKITRISEVNPSNCLNKDELVDTKTKQFYVLEWPRSDDTASMKKDPFWGTWEGYNTDTPNEKFIITFGYIRGRHNAELLMSGLPKNTPLELPFYSDNEGIGFEPKHINYKLIIAPKVDQYNYSNSLSSHFGLNFVGEIINGELKIQYEYNDAPYQIYLATGQRYTSEAPLKWVKKTFIGTKISNEVITQ